MRVTKVTPIYEFGKVSFFICLLIELDFDHVFFSHVVFFLNMLLNFIKLMDLFTSLTGMWVWQV